MAATSFLSLFSLMSPTPSNFFLFVFFIYFLFSLVLQNRMYCSFHLLFLHFALVGELANSDGGWNLGSSWVWWELGFGV
jgi:hypothetical protein